MKSLALILGLLAAVQVCNCNIQLCTAVMFGLAVEIIKICGSAQTDLRIFINTLPGRRWTSKSNGMKMKYTKECIKHGR
jgi:hypothetical protein